MAGGWWLDPPFPYLLDDYILYRLVNQARHRELKAGKIGLPVCPSALKQSVQGLCRPFPRNQFAQKTGRPILEIRIGAYHAGVAVPLILDIQPV